MSDHEWQESRLYVFKELERLTQEIRLLNEAEAVRRNRDEERARDIHEAHERIRDLRGKETTARTKQWALSGAATFLGIVVIELLKLLLKH